MEITKDFPGGNIRLIRVDGDHVFLENEIRDTTEDWFYWAFRVKGAAGRTVTFDFSPKAWIGYFGAAVSHDLMKWAWGGEVSEDRCAFTYAFGPDEDDVYFCHDLRYPVERFERFAKERKLPVSTLCLSEKGAKQPLVTLGEGEDVFLFTSRHHCCESTGTYVMEGILSELSERPIEGVKVLAVPFMDMDGVIAGDQGKSRAPHDHNRDYVGEPIYASVRAVKALAERYHIVYMLDLHSPWHLGGRNDVTFEVRKNLDLRPAQVRFGELLEEETRRDPASFQYRTVNDMDANVEWNRDEVMQRSSTGFFSHRESVRLCLSLETAYFGTPDNMATQENLVEYGRCVARALRAAWKEGV